jgi:quercetin dioxygenase-like cupin family protein
MDEAKPPPVRIGVMRAYVLALILGSAAVAVALAQPATERSQPPEGFSDMRPADLKWVANPAVPGGQVAVVFGDPNKALPFAIRVRLPAGARVMPHTHPETRTYTVIAGEWKLGFGRTFDTAALRAYPAGSVYHLPAGVAHFQATDTADTVVQIEATGPSATVYLDPKDDPRKK